MLPTDTDFSLRTLASLCWNWIGSFSKSVSDWQAFQISKVIEFHISLSLCLSLHCRFLILSAFWYLNCVFVVFFFVCEYFGFVYLWREALFSEFCLWNRAQNGEFGGDDIPYGVVFAALSMLFHTYIHSSVYMFINACALSTWSSWNLRKISIFYYIKIWNSLILDLKHNIW